MTLKREVLRPEGRGIFIILTLYAALTPLLTIGGISSFKIGISDILIIPAIVVFMTRSTGRVSLPAILSLIYAVLGLFAGVVVNQANGSGFVSTSTLQFVRSVGSLIPLVLISRSYGHDHTRSKFLIFTFLASGSLACAIGVFMFHAGIQVRDQQQRLWSGDDSGSTLRAGGLLGNSSDFGHLSALLVSAALVAWALYELRFVWLILITALGTYCAVIASSRAAILHIALSILIVLPISLRRRNVVPVLGAMAALLAAVVLVPSPRTWSFWNTPSGQRLDLFGFSGSSQILDSSVRVDTWQLALRMLKHNIAFGSGYGSILATSGQAGDNTFLSIFTELGAFAGLAFLAIWVCLLVQVIRSKDGAVRLASLSLLAGELVHCMTLDGMRLWSSMPVFMMLAGLVSARAEVTSESQMSELRDHPRFEPRRHDWRPPLGDRGPQSSRSRRPVHSVPPSSTRALAPAHEHDGAAPSESWPPTRAERFGRGTRETPS